MVSETLTSVAATVDELFVTLIVYVSVPLTTTGSGESVFVIDRSATWTAVVAVAVLLPGVLSLGDDTVALLVMEPAVAGALTTIVISGASPTGRLPAVRWHVTVPDALTQFQSVPVALTNDVPAGIVSTTFTAEAGSGPALSTSIV